MCLSYFFVPGTCRRPHPLCHPSHRACILPLQNHSTASCPTMSHFIQKCGNAVTRYGAPPGRAHFSPSTSAVAPELNATISKGNLSTDPDQKTTVHRAVSASLLCAARTSRPSNLCCAAQISWPEDNLSSILSLRSLQVAPTLYRTLHLLRGLPCI